MGIPTKVSKGEFLSTPSARRATPFIVQITASSLFLSTPSARRATHLVHLLDGGIDISIHALREEGDRCRRCPAACLQDFYPRPPRGGRPLGSKAPVKIYSISIHALREEGD